MQITRIPKNGPLADHHIQVLQALAEVEPCGLRRLANYTGLGKTVGRMVSRTLVRRGLVSWETERLGVKVRRKPGTLHLTRQGREALKSKSLLSAT